MQKPRDRGFPIRRCFAYHPSIRWQRCPVASEYLPHIMANYRKSPLIKELVEALASVDLTDVRRPEGTGMLDACIRSTCRKLRYRCLPEYPAGLILGRNSYIDFVCSQRSGFGKTYNVAIE